MGRDPRSCLSTVNRFLDSVHNEDMTTGTFLWHDYETFGTDPRRDRPCQFAALRTDERLVPVGEPVVLFCQPSSDVLPTPEACLVTGITPQQAMRDGVPEYEFARRIHELMSEPGTCTVGFNNLRFDDEVTRFLFWRNFIDPYAREFRNGNRRFDIIDLARMCRALRPEGLEWPTREDGSASFRLEDLSAANGFPVEHAHDALADVENTCALAARIRDRQPRLWAWALSLRDKTQVEQLLERRCVLLHATARYPAGEACIAPVLPLFRHPDIRTQWLVWNLRHDPAPFESLSEDLLSDLYWTASADLPDEFERLPVKWVRSNRCPMLAPVGVLNRQAAATTGIDPEEAEQRAQRLVGASGFFARLQQALVSQVQRTAPDAETALYEGFVGAGDRRLADRLREQTFEDQARQVNTGVGPFQDDRLNELLLHYVGRHAPALLNPEAETRWQDYRRRRLLDDPDLASIRLEDYAPRIEQLSARFPERTALFDALRAWPAELGLETLEARR